jgi:hypothetical protein
VRLRFLLSDLLMYLGACFDSTVNRTERRARCSV